MTSTQEVVKIFDEIESAYNTTKELDDGLVERFIAELKKFENGPAAVKEFSWLFGLGEADHHIVASKECKKIFLVDFRLCRKFLNKFLSN